MEEELENLKKAVQELTEKLNMARERVYYLEEKHGEDHVMIVVETQSARSTFHGA